MSNMIESEEFWNQQLDKLKASGLTRAQYCRENGVNYDRFGYWISRFRSAPAKFLPVNVQVSESSNRSATLCTLELRGHMIKIHDLSALSFILDRMS